MAATVAVSFCFEGPVTPHQCLPRRDEFPSPAGRSSLDPPDLHAPSRFPTAMAAASATSCSEGLVTVRTSERERSARTTSPELEGFWATALMRGFRRVFAHAAPIFIECGIANEATKHWVTCSNSEA